MPNVFKTVFALVVGATSDWMPCRTAAPADAAGTPTVTSRETAATTSSSDWFAETPN
jgi:hypothetical protein